MEKTKKLLSAGIILFVLVCGGILLKYYSIGKFDSVATLREFMQSLGMLGPAALILLQALQVVVPVLPGFLGCAVGAVLFGAMGGFWCNYIGISLGSIAAFFLARHYGIEIVQVMFSKEKYDKWSAKVATSKRYEMMLFIATLLPLFPDDFLCYFSGLIRMNARRFNWIILLGKPWCILVYSFVFSMIGV